MKTLVALAALVLAACTSVAREEELDSKEARWRAVEVEAPSDRVVWQLMLLTLRTQGYPLSSGTDAGAGTIESGWKTDLQPFRGEGERRRAIVRMTPLAPGRFKLEARVRREENENLVSPLQAELAEWEPAADDPVEAAVLLQHVRARLASVAAPDAPPDASADTGSGAPRGK